jgi:energy-coupling factor transporter transmembrane protein EcfT
VTSLVCAGTLAVLLESPLALALLALWGAVAFAVAPVPASIRRLLALVLAGVVWSSVLGQGFFHVGATRTAWLVLLPEQGRGLFADGLVLSREGVVHGSVQSLRFCGLILLGVAVTSSLSPERLLRGLTALRVPAVLAFSVTTALRAVPELGRAWSQVRRAATLRGLGPDLRHPLRSVGREIALLRPMLVRTLLRSQQLALAARARGLDLSSPGLVAAPEIEPMPRRQRVLLGILLAVTLAVVLLRSLFFAYAAGLPGVPAWYGLYDGVRRFL